MKFDIDTKGFENALVRYKIACKRDWQFVVKQQARLVGQKLVSYTPPKNLSSGKKNVASDIGKVFADLGSTKWEDKSLSKMWRAGNFEGIKKALNDHPNKAELPIFQYDKIFQKPVRAIHKKAISRSGRVSKNWQTRYAIAGRGERKKYITAIQKNVGTAKSGWLAGLIRLGGKAPSFVTRHGSKYGKAINATSGDNPSFTFINNVKTFPKGQAPKRILQRAINAQTMAMNNNIKRILTKRRL